MRLGASAPAAGRSWWGSGGLVGPAAAGGADMGGARTSLAGICQGIYSFIAAAATPNGLWVMGTGGYRWRGTAQGTHALRLDGSVRPQGGR